MWSYSAREHMHAVSCSFIPFKYSCVEHCIYLGVFDGCSLGTCIVSDNGEIATRTCIQQQMTVTDRKITARGKRIAQKVLRRYFPCGKSGCDVDSYVYI